MIPRSISHEPVPYNEYIDTLRSKDKLIALQDAALDVLAEKYIDKCFECPAKCSFKIISGNRECMDNIKAYALEEARRRMG